MTGAENLGRETDLWSRIGPLVSRIQSAWDRGDVRILESEAMCLAQACAAYLGTKVAAKLGKCSMCEVPGVTMYPAPKGWELGAVCRQCAEELTTEPSPEQELADRQRMYGDAFLEVRD